MPGAAPTISLEFFPPKTPEGETSLWNCLDTLSGLRPAFMTMTHGAGGSTRDKTVALAVEMARRSGQPVASHLTLVATPRTELRRIAEGLWDNNVRHIVALRGDLPSGKIAPPPDCPNHFSFTSDFIEGLKSWHDFEISVGAYPEKHPDAPSLDADIEALKKKCGAGANRAITQFFFDNDVFYKFRDKVAQKGIATPLVPGILPIGDFGGMTKFAARCQADVPGWLRARFEAVKDDPEGQAALSAEIIAAQVTDWRANGVDHFHFYTLNHSKLPIKACAALGISLK
jgi:methylenetetrahydrofolate reductase (NADPH)